MFYDLDRFNSTDMKKERAIRGSSEGYLTLVNTRHPLARLLSAWHDKFRKGHPWMKYIEKMYGNILKKLEKRDMTLEKFTYSFEAFMELGKAHLYFAISPVRLYCFSSAKFVSLQ